MYTYEYETVSSEYDGWGPFEGNRYKTGNFKEIIEMRAKNGWRYVGYIPSNQRGTGHADEMTLVFEKEI